MVSWLSGQWSSNQTKVGLLVGGDLVPVRRYLHVLLAPGPLGAHAGVAAGLDHAALTISRLDALVALELVDDGGHVVVLNWVPSQLDARLVKVVDGQVLGLGGQRQARARVVVRVDPVVAVQACAKLARVAIGPAILRAIGALRLVGQRGLVLSLGTGCREKKVIKSIHGLAEAISFSLFILPITTLAID